jgi:adenylosuccinate lyase
MIERYSVSAISSIWSDQSKFDFFLKVECALLEAFEKSDLFPEWPKGLAAKCRHLKVDLQRIATLEQTLHHDVIAFTTSISEQLPPEEARFFHYGVTSSDIIDTALSLQIKSSLDLIEKQLEGTLKALEGLIARSRHLIAVGRSHGISAEPMIFAQKWVGHYTEFKRRQRDWLALKEICQGQFSGAVGNYMVLNHRLEKMACASLGLTPFIGSTQVIARDGIAKVVLQGSLLAVAIERIATELRLLQHSDINEASEGFRSGQKGSSTMPHKKNPISSENLCGLARVLRSHTHIALDNCLLWHERDISHSSAERLYLPDFFHLLHYSLQRLTGVLENLVLHEDIITNKVLNRPELFSSALLHHLLRVTSFSREDLYAVIQHAFFQKPQSLQEAFSLISAHPLFKGHPPLALKEEEAFHHLHEEFSQTLKALHLN